MAGRTLHGNEKLICKNECHISVNTAIDIKSVCNQRRNFIFIILPVIYCHSKNIIFTWFYKFRNIKIERTISSLMIAKIFAIQPYFAIFLHTFKLNKNLPVGIFPINGKVFSVPAPALSLI